MTENPDIERVLERWFAEGPTRMPDRLFDAVVHRIERVPQRRLARLRTRVLAINIKFALAAAAVVLVVLGVSALSTAPSVTVGPSPTPPSPTEPSRSAQAAEVPADVEGQWVPAAVPAAGARLGASSITISTTQVRMHVDSQYFDSASTFVPPDRLDLVLSADSELLACRAGDQGSYALHLSADGVLTFSPLHDACAARAAILASPWTLFVRGTATQGPFVATLFRPFGRANRGQFSYDVPAGWSTQDETADVFVQQGPLDDGRVVVLADAIPSAPDGACVNHPAGVARTPVAIAAWLAAQPGLVVSSPTRVTIGGLTGLMLDLDPSVAPGRQSPCPAGDVMAGPHGTQLVEVAVTGHTRYILLARGDGHAMLIALEAQARATWDALLPAAMVTIDSFQFSH